jgi:hypothetical protein
MQGMWKPGSMTYIMYTVNDSWAQTIDQIEIEKGMTA